MLNQFHHAEDVLARLMAWQAGGASCALAIVTGVNGGSMRGPGALMVINETGDTAGYISGGCVDGDIAARAQGAITRGENIDLRYGDGSPFKDIALPCGGSIDVLLLGRPHRKIVTALSDALARRQGLTVYANAKTGLSLSDSGGFKHIYQPKLRLQIAGRGAAMTALARQADAAGFEVFAATPDPDDLAALGGLTAQMLLPGQSAFDRPDPWTAVTVMFHDHDLEPLILMAALKSPAFFVGAMGSRKTHAARLERLRGLGADAVQCGRIHGPVGLVPSLRDANLVAISTLAHIVQAAQDEGKL